LVHESYFEKKQIAFSKSISILYNIELCIVLWEYLVEYYYYVFSINDYYQVLLY